MPRRSVYTAEQIAAAVEQANQVPEGGTKKARVEEVAKNVGISPSTLVVWMRGKTSPAASTPAAAAPRKPKGRPKKVGAVGTAPAAAAPQTGSELERIRAEIQRLKARALELVLG